MGEFGNEVAAAKLFLTWLHATCVLIEEKSPAGHREKAKVNLLPRTGYDNYPDHKSSMGRHSINAGRRLCRLLLKCACQYGAKSSSFCLRNVSSSRCAVLDHTGKLSVRSL